MPGGNGVGTKSVRLRPLVGRYVTRERARIAGGLHRRGSVARPPDSLLSVPRRGRRESPSSLTDAKCVAFRDQQEASGFGPIRPDLARFGPREGFAAQSVSPCWGMLPALRCSGQRALSLPLFVQSGYFGISKYPPFRLPLPRDCRSGRVAGEGSSLSS
jgi:hypothetical protein